VVKITSKGISMKLLVLAYVAQTCADAGRKGCGGAVMAYGVLPTFRGGQIGWISTGLD